MSQVTAAATRTPAEVVRQTSVSRSPNGINYATAGEVTLATPDLERMIAAVPSTVAAALERKAYYFVPLTVSQGDDTLIAGTAAPGSTVSNDMWGDGQLSDRAQGGKDLFVFKDVGSMTVGTQNTVEDFSQSQQDKIEFSGVAGVQSFADLIISQVDTATIITAGADQVTLHNFTNPLTANDFLFV